MNCLFSIDRLAELFEAGEVGEVAPSHDSFMGDILDPEALLKQTVPAIIGHLQREEVDLVVPVPA